MVADDINLNEILTVGLNGHLGYRLQSKKHQLDVDRGRCMFQ